MKRVCKNCSERYSIDKSDLDFLASLTSRIGLQRKEYCIFNKQYSKEAYYKEVSCMVTEMARQNEWGEFFPIYFTPRAYTTSAAYRYFPKTKSEAQKIELSWFEDKSLNI